MRTAVAGLSVLICLAFAAGASELELVQNGDFEGNLAPGWDEENFGSGLLLEHAFDIHPDMDYEVRLSTDNGSGTVRIWQDVYVPGVDVDFSASLTTSASDGGGAWCAAGLDISYRDEVGAELGRTFLGSTGDACPWTNGPTVHLIDTTGDWQDYTLKLDTELDNLPGVDADRVARLTVTLLVTAANC